MDPGQPDQFTPFLNRSSSPEHDSISDYKHSLGAGTAQTPLRRSGRKFELRSFLSKLLGWPAIVIAGQLGLQLAAWTFFAVVQSRGSIALPFRAAAWVQDHVHTVTFIFTQISTILAACSSFLFSWGVRQSIALHLHGDGMSLAQFVSSVKLSSRSLIFDARKQKWSTLSIVLILLTGVQAAGWSSLLTPLMISIDTRITGYEIDLTNPSLRALQTQGMKECVENSPRLPAFVVGQSESGSAAVKAEIGFSASLTLLDQSFNNATAGILPLYFGDIPTYVWFPNIPTIPSTITAKLSEGLTSTSTVTQQGFTAAVDCEFQQLTPDTTPSLTTQIDKLRDWDSGLPSGNISSYSISSNCLTDERLATNSERVYIDTDVPNPSTLLMVACDSDDGYTLIFKASGAYSFMQTMVCKLTPQVTSTTVTYTGGKGSLGSIQVATATTGAVSDAGGPASLSAVGTIYEMVGFAQAAYTNVMGDQLEALLSGQFSDASVLAVTQTYLRGVTEYSGSVFRACLSGVNSTFANGVPLDLSTPVTGKVSTQTIGWMHVSIITLLGLVPGTLMAILTICIVVLAVAQHAGNPDGEKFDASDPMYLITAAAAGGLGNVIVGTEAEQLRAAEDVHLHLEDMPGRGQTLYPSLPPV
ncbi:hypothetical protein B0H16DRAFT_1578639 [Mycena metata]|uniref:Uncharacterized protein n=1 Tax=Mycena metata TaxID=1033252 RepID=A0AAD7MV12_9AGAR|nr:hypothetical protein B0H16DRAFT_1578639 [Mycena metata]